MQPYPPSPLSTPLPCIAWAWTGYLQGDPTLDLPFLPWISMEIVRSMRARLCSPRLASHTGSRS